MPRKAPDCRSNLSIADKRKVLKIYEERAVGVGISRYKYGISLVHIIIGESNILEPFYGASTG